MTNVDTTSAIDPYRQKGMFVPIAVQIGDDRITIYPKLNLVLAGILIVGWMGLVAGVFAVFAPTPWFIAAALIGTVLCIGILSAFYYERSQGPYAVIDLKSHVLWIPRLKLELTYLEICRVETGWRWERVGEDNIPYQFLDAEILDSDRRLRWVTLVASGNRWEFKRLEKAIRTALQFDGIDGGVSGPKQP